MRLRAVRAILVLALLPGAAGAATRNYTVTFYDRIRLIAPYAVTLAVGPTGAARAEGAAADLDRVRIDVQGRTLTIAVDRTSGGWDKAAGPVRIAVSTPDLVGATITGSGTLAIDRVKAQRFDLSVTGSGGMTLGALATDRLVATVIGSGSAKVAGRAATARIAVQGSGGFDGKALSVPDAEIVSSGAGEVTLIATRAVKVTASGAGGVTVSGPAACQVHRSGSGEVSCGR